MSGCLSLSSLQKGFSRRSFAHEATPMRTVSLPPRGAEAHAPAAARARKKSAERATARLPLGMVSVALRLLLPSLR